MNKLALIFAVLSTSLAWGDLSCSAEIAPMYFAEFRVNENAGKIFMTATHQTAEAPYAKNSNPAETLWYAQFSKDRSITIVQRHDIQTTRICIDGNACHPCRTTN